MITQTQSACHECRGEGQIMSEKDKCKVCKGIKIADETKELEVALEPGVPEDHDYILSGESDETPGVEAGDLYMRVRIKKHPTFVRKGADLFYEKHISLLEALTGFNFTLTHLDEKAFTITTTPNEVI